MTLTIDSFSREGVAYNVDLCNLSCTCPDWKHRRSSRTMNDEGRLCRHLVAAQAAYALTLKAKAAQVADEHLPRLIEKYQGDPAILEALLDERERRLEAALRSGRQPEPKPEPLPGWNAMSEAERKALFA